ncbi:DMT family transporter [Gammaproteobacteria bacterium]|nr:DMT family transporter [Gammaproteobacteria bacterium]
MDQLHHNHAGYAFLMLFAGMGIPIMAALNAGLGAKLQSPALAATILFLVGLIGSTIFLLVFEGVPSSGLNKEIPIYFYSGGLFVLFYVLSISWVAPRFGIGNAISFVLLGQLLAMITVDQFGLMGAQQTSLTWQRIIGLVFMSIGVFLVVRK